MTESFLPLQAAGTIPAINGLGFVMAGGQYLGWAVGDSGLVLRTSFAVASYAGAVAPLTRWSVVNGTAISSAVYLPSGFLNLYGITWDNALTGYIFGAAVILSTHDGGATWALETGNAIVTLQAPVVAVASVPTQY